MDVVTFVQIGLLLGIVACATYLTLIFQSNCPAKAVKQRPVSHLAAVDGLNPLTVAKE